MKRVCFIAVCLVSGCSSGVPPLSSAAESIVRKFESQMPQHKTAAFDQLCDEVGRLRKENRLNDEEAKALHGVCDKAKEGQWDTAESNLKPLLDALSKKK